MVSIIILVQDRFDFFSRCITSILEHTKTPYQFVFIVQGKVEERITDLIKTVSVITPTKVIFNVENNGVTPGRNQGIEIAEGDYLLFFDDDAFVNEDLPNIPESERGMDWLERLLQYYKHPQVGIVSQSGSWIKPDQRGVFWAYNDGRGCFCDVGMGYCYMFSRAVVNAIGGLDPFFGKFWHEESEYALRAKASGFKVVNAGYIGVWHLGSGSGDDGTYTVKSDYMYNKWQAHFPTILEDTSSRKRVLDEVHGN